MTQAYNYSKERHYQEKYVLTPYPIIYGIQEEKLSFILGKFCLDDEI